MFTNHHNSLNSCPLLLRFPALARTRLQIFWKRFSFLCHGKCFRQSVRCERKRDTRCCCRFSSRPTVLESFTARPELDSENRQGVVHSRGVPLHRKQRTHQAGRGSLCVGTNRRGSGRCSHRQVAFCTISRSCQHCCLQTDVAAKASARSLCLRSILYEVLDKPFTLHLFAGGLEAGFASAAKFGGKALHSALTRSCNHAMKKGYYADGHQVRVQGGPKKRKPCKEWKPLRFV